MQFGVVDHFKTSLCRTVVPQRALASPEGQATTSDLSNFASGGVTVFADEEQVAIPVNLPATLR